MSDLIIELNQLRKKLDTILIEYQKSGEKLAKAESEYKYEQAKKIILLNQYGYEGELGKTKPVAITACEKLSHGLEPVKTKRLERDVANYNMESLKELIYKYKLDIRVLERMIWGELKGV